MTMLNPIQQKIDAGMNPLVAFFSERTCSEACWEAREDICRCSCFGKNHGCMRDGVRPDRTAKIDGLRYVLKATARDHRDDPAHSELYDQAMSLNKTHWPQYGYWRSWDTNVRRAPARIRNATKSQLYAWPELASYRETIYTIRDRNHAPIEIMEQWPQLLWVREDIASAA